jgi:ribosomal protein S27E
MSKAIKRAEHSKVNWHHRKMKGIMGIMCPECKNITYIEGSYSFNLKNVECPSNLVSARIIYKIQCNWCGTVINTTQDPIDPNIAPIISILNKKGYTTIESCEGHQCDGENSSQPYILFAGNKIETVIANNPLPEGFYIDKKDPKNRIGTVVKYTIKTTDKKYPGTMALVTELRRWANRI